MAEFGITFPMLWDTGFESWQHFGVASQPAWIMFDPDGQALDGWLGQLDEGAVLSLAAEHARA